MWSSHFIHKKPPWENYLNTLHIVFYTPENDTYVACAGEVNRKCYSEEVSVRKHHADLLRVFFKFTDCYDEETKKCDAPIARHTNTVIQAFKKHLQEKHGLFGKMIEGIKD